MARKDLYQTSLDIANADLELTKHNLRLKITELYFNWQVYAEMEVLALRADSLYSLAVDYMALRTKAGESDPMGLSMAKLQKFMSGQELQETRSLMLSTLMELRFYCGFDSTQTPGRSNLILDVEIPPDTLNWSAHPFLIASQLNVEQSQIEMSLTKASALPDFSIGYNNMSIKGFENIDGQDIYHDAADRFQWVGAGIQIPLFTSAHKKIAYSQTQLNKNLAEYIFEKTLFWSEYQNAIVQYLNLKALNEKTTSIVFPETDRMISAAESRLRAGEIDGVQWVTSINQAITARKQALQSVQSCNSAAIRLQSFIQTK